MCGIFGFFNRQSELNVDTLHNIMAKMSTDLNHRGPDDNGTWTNGKFGLGHNRLSILDLSPQSHQPMNDSEEKVKIVFNGEIYNFQILRAVLIKEGHSFKSTGDTEVILKGYLAWGKAVFARLRGMFAIAIWDSRTDELILARDSIGKKPLYYGFCSKNSLVFASEIKAILNWPTMLRKPNLEAIHHFLTFQYVPAPLTAFSYIQQIPHGYLLIVNGKGQIQTERYWHLSAPNKQVSEKTFPALKEELFSQLKESVKMRMVADVSVGALLSGGVDSSAIVAMMSLESMQKIKTFSVGFNEEAYDERKYARIVAERFGTEHHELIVEPKAVEILPKLIWHYGQPFADPSAIPCFYVSEFARKHVKVVLTGDGGDENFIGYSRYESCFQYLKGANPPNVLSKIKQAFMRLRGHPVTLNSRRYEPYICYFSDRDKKLGYGEALLPYLEKSSLDILEHYFAQMPNIVDGACWADINTYLIDDILIKLDVASMAYSLEARSPFLDQHFMKWTSEIPYQQKLMGGTLKGFLKKSFEDYLPDEILYRKKMGFGVPIDEWFKRELKEMAYDTLLSTQAIARGLFEPAYVKLMLDEHCAGVRLHHTRLWGLLMLELWYRMWIDSRSAPSDVF